MTNRVTISFHWASEEKTLPPFTPQRPRFPGIVRDSQILGVSRIHLYFVLTGVRKSPLLNRYRALKQSEDAK